MNNISSDTPTEIKYYTCANNFDASVTVRSTLQTVWAATRYWKHFERKAYYAEHNLKHLEDAA